MGAVMHRTSAEANGPAIDDQPTYNRRQHDAATGSEALRLAMRQQFMDFARRHGTTLADATLFCMNAEEPR